MRRIATAGTLALVLVASMAEVATGGGAVFEFDRRYYAPGDRVSGRVTFGRGTGGSIRAEAGPFVAYVVPNLKWINAPRIPAGAIPVGPMHLERSEYGDWAARVDFTLPDVPPGGYTLSYCNDPCTDSSLGELVGGWFQVVPSHDLIPLYESHDRLQERVRALRGKVGTVDRRNDSLAHEVSVLRDANRALEQRLGQLERARRPEPASVPEIPAPVGWALVGLTVLFGMLAFRPHRKAPPGRATPMDPPAMERIDDPDPEPALRP
jgi:hypothetical protein